MDLSSRILVRKIVIDVTCFAVVSIAVLMFFLFGKPYHRGFFCNDESLRHPYHDSTVTNVMLYIVGIVIPVCVMLCGEYFYAKNSNGQASIVLFGRVIPPWLVLAYHKIGLFGFGAVTNILVTDIAKYSIGRLRPHFIDVCKPSIDCTLKEHQHVYIENFTCLGSATKDTRLSFPSGHSSFSAYVMIYLVMYLQLRMTWKGSKLLRHFLQLFCLMLAWFTAMSRVSDYKHHWSDVLAGLLIGTLVSFVMVFGVADLFKERRRRDPGDAVTMMGVLTANTDKPQADYDAETAMQVESTPLRRTNDEVLYGGIPASST